MKKIGLIVFLCVSFVCVPVFAYAPITMQQFLSSYFSVLLHGVQVPSPYQDIRVKYSNISSQSALYVPLQKAIYLGWFPNASLALPLDKPITESQAVMFMRYAYPNVDSGGDTLLRFEWLRDVLLQVQHTAPEKNIAQKEVPNTSSLFQSPVFLDVYSKIQQEYIGTGSFDTKAMQQGTIKGYVDALNDPYTSYFPPVDAKSFTDELEGEFYGIGAYVEMSKPGVMIITSPIPSSPAEKIGLQAQDRIVQIDAHVIDKDTPLSSAISWIKGPTGTKVTLKIIRGGELLTFTIVRAKIVIKNVESERIALSKTTSACVVRIRMFDIGASRDFYEVLSGLSAKACTKYIFDVRNNPGGSLEEVSNILDTFVPSGESILQTKSKTYTEDIFASNQTAKLTGSLVRILVNGGSASASEIFAGVVREYIPHTLLVGSQTFGKGSVQNLVNYSDGSMLKYTIAKWYTGKEKKNIDHIGFPVDVKVEDTTGTKVDEVLQWAVRN